MSKTLPNNNTSDISDNKNTEDKYEKLVSFAQKEIEWVRGAYKWLAGLITLIFIVGAAFTWGSFNELRSEVGNIKKEITKKIEIEFEDENVRELVKTAAEKRIDIVADNIIEEKIDEKLSPELAVLNNKITKSTDNIHIIENKISSINPKLSQITQELITFSFIIGNKPVFAFGGMTTEYKRELEDLARSLGQQLMFNADSLLKDIERREIELNNEYLQRRKQSK